MQLTKPHPSTANNSVQLLRTSRPKADENLMGYLLRLADLNGYERLHWILRLAGFRSHFLHKNCPIPFVSEESLHRLAFVTRSNVKELVALTYSSPRRGGLGLRLFNGSPIHQFVLRTKTPRLCPECFHDSAYCRRVWDIALVTVCLRHKRLLIDECPGCRRRITWLRSQVSACHCGYDWRQSPPLPVAEPELVLTRHLHYLCKVKDETAETALVNHKAPAFKLTLKDFVTAIIFIVRQYQKTLLRRSRVLAGHSTELHQLFVKAYATLTEWPDNYYSFLAWQQTKETHFIHKSKNLGFRTTKDFGRLYTGLQTTLAGRQFNFMRVAFKKYLKTKSSNSIGQQGIEKR